MAPVLELRQFGLAYNDRQVLKAVDLCIPDAGLTVLLGPSGTGKSSLLRTLAGFNDLHPALRTWGEVVYRDPAGRRPALVMQKASLMVSTVLENLVSSLPERSTLTRLEQVALLTEFTGPLGADWIIDRLSWPVSRLEFHEQRAVAVLREALARPALLMLDEPTDSLGDAGAAALRQLIAAVAAIQPVLMVSHHLGEARQLADRIVLVAGGVVQESATKEAFFASPSSEAGRRFLRTGSCPEEALDPANAAPEGTPEPEPEPGQVAEPPPAAFRSRYMGPRGFVWLLPGRLAGTPWPGIVRETDEDLDALRNVGVTRLVSLTEIPFDSGHASRFGMRCAGFPIPDMHAPSLETAEAFCRDMDRWLDEGDVVAIHCRAGLGRTGAMLAAYWLWNGRGRHDAIQAIEQVRRMESGMIQSQAQVDFLSRFADRLRDRAATV